MNTTIKFTRQQAEFLQKRLGSEDLREAIDTFCKILKEVNFDPNKVEILIKRLMELPEA